MHPRAACEHSPGRWEVNEKEKFFTSRCAQCGAILDRITFAQAPGIKVVAIKRYMERLLS